MSDKLNLIGVRIGTKNDVNGNPRRGIIFYHAETGDAVVWGEENYRGVSGVTDALNERYGDCHTLVMLSTLHEVTVTEFNSWAKDSKRPKFVKTV